MKYRALPTVPLKRYAPELPEGVSLETCDKEVDPKRLSDCCNIWSDGGVLRTRPSVTCREEDLAQLGRIEYVARPLTFTDTTVLYGGSIYRIAYLLSQDGISYQDFRIFLVSASGETLSIGSLRFNRLDSFTFYTTSSLLFFQGKPTSGSGIYALVNRYSKGSNIYNIYEADSALENWNGVYDYYCPTIYINGRGTRYSEAEDKGSVYDVHPESPEKPNLLTGNFKAFFSSDGFSSAFQLPVANLADENVTCRMYTSPENYIEWLIPAGDTSKSASFGSQEVIMNCDRKHGLVYFNDESGAFAVPSAPQYGPNNIMIIATKTTETGRKRVIGCDKCTVFSSRVFLYANPDYPSEIYSARLDNPLYFPDASYVSVGDVSEEIVRLEAIGSRLTAFKPKGIYTVRLKEGGRYIPDIPVGETAADFEGLFSADTLSSEPAVTNIGCDCPNSICICAGAAVWLNSNGSVYMLPASSSAAEQISAPIGSALAAITPDMLKAAFAVCRGGIYYLFAGEDTVFVLDYRGSSFSYRITDSNTRAWYIWKLPETMEVNSAAADGDKVLLCCSSTDGNLQYISEFAKGPDTALVMTDSGIAVEKTPIKASFSTVGYRLSGIHTLKRIDEFFISFLCGGRLNVELEGERKCSFTLTGYSDRLKTARILPNIRLSEGVRLTVSSESDFGISGISIAYRELPTVRWAAT